MGTLGFAYERNQDTASIKPLIINLNIACGLLQMNKTHCSEREKLNYEIQHQDLGGK